MGLNILQYADNDRPTSGRLWFTDMQCEFAKSRLDISILPCHVSVPKMLLKSSGSTIPPNLVEMYMVALGLS